MKGMKQDTKKTPQKPSLNGQSHFFSTLAMQGIINYLSALM